MHRVERPGEAGADEREAADDEDAGGKLHLSNAPGVALAAAGQYGSGHQHRQTGASEDNDRWHPVAPLSLQPRPGGRRPRWPAAHRQDRTDDAKEGPVRAETAFLLA